MIFSLFRRRSRQDTISTLYGTIVAQARLPCFYREYGVPDTVNGRFDLLVLHLAIVLDRLAEGSELRTMGQALFDRFCEDMDNNLREIGIDDPSVPKEMQRIGEAFYGRAQAYRSALGSDRDEALVAALSRNVYGGSVPQAAAPVRLAAYIRKAVRGLEAQPPADLLAGKAANGGPNPLMFLLKAKVTGQKTETDAEKPIPVERAGGRR